MGKPSINGPFSSSQTVSLPEGNNQTMGISPISPSKIGIERTIKHYKHGDFEP